MGRRKEVRGHASDHDDKDHSYNPRLVCVLVLGFVVVATGVSIFNHVWSTGCDILTHKTDEEVSAFVGYWDRAIFGSKHTLTESMTGHDLQLKALPFTLLLDEERAKYKTPEVRALFTAKLESAFRDSRGWSQRASVDYDPSGLLLKVCQSDRAFRAICGFGSLPFKTGIVAEVFYNATGVYREMRSYDERVKLERLITTDLSLFERCDEFRRTTD